MPILTEKTTDKDINSLENLLHDIYNNILPPAPENIEKNKLVEDKLDAVNCIYTSMVYYHANSNKSLINRAAQIINQFYVDLITRAILANNISCANTLINQAPPCCRLKLNYPSINAAEIEIVIDTKIYSISVRDAKIPPQFLLSFLGQLQVQADKKRNTDLTRADSELLPKSMMANWMVFFEDDHPSRGAPEDTIIARNEGKTTHPEESQFGGR